MTIRTGTPNTCSQCHAAVECSTDAGSEFAPLIFERGYCFECAFWETQLSRVGQPGWFVTPDYQLYRFQSQTTSSAVPQHIQSRGYFGARFEIQLLPSGDVVYSDDLWYVGEIPERFRARATSSGVILRRNVESVTTVQAAAESAGLER